MPQEALIDRAFLEKLERLTIHWQRSFAGLVGGHNSSRFAGPGQEFLDHRRFHHGDDLRAVNWRAYLRLEKLFLKMFQVEPRIPVRLLLDSSLSMTTGNPAKFDYARKLTAALCYIGLVRLDTIHIQPFQSDLLESYTCSGGRHRFVPAVNYLTSLEPRGHTHYLEAMRQFIGKFPSRGLVIIISDFLDDEDCERPLQYLADFGNELLLVHVWAEEDRTPPWNGELDLTDVESGHRMEVSLDEGARARYTAAFDAHARNLQIMANRNGGRYAGLPTSVSLEDAIFDSLIQARGIE